MLAQLVTKQQIDDTPLFLGIDGGGTKCQAIIYQHDKVIGSGKAGPANPFHGYEQTIHSVVSATELALEDAGLPPQMINQLIAGVGLAGVNLPHLYERVNNWQHPFKMMFLTTDLHIACVGSHEAQDGAVIITGTGSCGFSYAGHRPLTMGGHGFPHGDKGSGAWMGFKAVEHVLMARDGLAEPTTLTESVCTQFGVKDEIELVTAINGQRSSFFAQLAIHILDAADAGDLVAQRIVREGADYISELAGKLWQTKPCRMSIIGGLSPRLTAWLDKDIASRLSAPLSPPEIGAVIFARDQLALLQQTAVAVSA
ncbi:MAG: glucosamine kinase [Phenylobacterium sp.]|jgi:glucosamine kinase